MKKQAYLSPDQVEQVLGRLGSLTIGVFGDLFLDRYLDLDADLTEPSLETGLDAYQVVQVRSLPGAAGTVLNNLAALGVGRICPIAIVGDDGEGHELRQALARLGAVDPTGIHAWDGRRTPTYTKPMLQEKGKPPRELNRLDIKNRSPVPAGARDLLWSTVCRLWPQLDALLVLDQVSEPDCGVVTADARQRLPELGKSRPGTLLLADSRELIAHFQGVSLKPNRRECLLSAGFAETGPVEKAARVLADRCGRPVFCTLGEEGILVVEPGKEPLLAPGCPVAGPTDPVGAGDSTSAGIASAWAAGLSPVESAAFGNLVASITVQQLGTTGTASPDQLRARCREVLAT